MTIADRMRDKLTRALQPTRLEIHDDSQAHQGHAGSRPGRESHFRLEIVSPAFAGETRLARQRRVHAVLAEELRETVHALQLSTLTPEEDQARQR